MQRLKPATPINTNTTQPNTYKPIDRLSQLDNSGENFEPMDLQLNLDLLDKDNDMPSDDTNEAPQFEIPDIPDFMPDE